MKEDMMRRFLTICAAVLALVALSAPIASAGPARATIDDVTVLAIGPLMSDDCGRYCVVEVRITVTAKGSYLLALTSVVGDVAYGGHETMVRGSGTRTFTMTTPVPAGSAAVIRATLIRSKGGMDAGVVDTGEAPSLATCPST